MYDSRVKAETVWLLVPSSKPLYVHWFNAPERLQLQVAPQCKTNGNPVPVLSRYSKEGSSHKNLWVRVRLVLIANLVAAILRRLVFLKIILGNASRFLLCWTPVYVWCLRWKWHNKTYLLARRMMFLFCEAAAAFCSELSAAITFCK